MSRCYLVIFCIYFLTLYGCYGYPINPGAMVASSSVGLACLALVFLVLSVLFLIGCACCRQGNQGFKQFSNSTTSLHQIGFNSTGPLSTNNEVAIFPPPGVVLSSPVPDVRSIQRTSSPRPAALASSTVSAASALTPDVSSWFVDPNGHIPRQQIFYQREIGKGWFGKVVEGEAKGSRVVVRILREDSTAQEKSYFLEEAQPYRDLRHRNILSLRAKSLHHEPYLLLFDLCTNGDLKSFLLTNSASKSVLNDQGICLKMMTDIAEGLNYMHENSFIHTDLAARNCLVSSDLTIKIGDYGTSIDKYKDEYYITENVAIPIRWCAPESLHCTPTTIEAKQVTVDANVWSLGVVLWEIAEFGRLPYDELTDDQVIIRVFGSEKLRLPQPDCPYGVFLFNVLGLCWRVSDRAMLSQVLSMLYYLRSGPGEDKQVDFDSRWSQTKPNTVPRLDNHPLANSREFDSGVDLEMKSCRSLTLSAASDDLLQSKRSASLNNLQGSLEDVQGNSATGDEQEEEEENTKRPLVPSFRLGPLGGKSDSSSDTEEETWRTRIERGEFTEKVKEKSKSVTDLMVLTHIDSEGSESDSLPSLQPRKSLTKPAYTSIGFGSEGNIRDALLSEELQTALKQLTAAWKPTDSQQHFLGKAASETNYKQSVGASSIESDNKQVLTTSSPSVPEITVTEASILDTAFELDNEVLQQTQYSFDTEPRKLKIVCRDDDLSSSTCSRVEETNTSIIDDNIPSFNSSPSKNVNECTVNDLISSLENLPISLADIPPPIDESVLPVNDVPSSLDNLPLSINDIPPPVIDLPFSVEDIPPPVDVPTISYECANPVDSSKPRIQTEFFQQSALMSTSFIEEPNSSDNLFFNTDDDKDEYFMTSESEIIQSPINDKINSNNYSYEELENHLLNKINLTDRCDMDILEKPVVDKCLNSEIRSNNSIKASLSLSNSTCVNLSLSADKEEFSKREKLNDECESNVILGSCEDYTLEYFKGLKTTYVPPSDSISEEGSDGGEDRAETGEDSDFINDESQASQVESAPKVKENQRGKTIRQDSGDDPYPDSMSASVTTVSSSSGYATIEKDKIIRNEYNYIEESYSPAKDKVRTNETDLDDNYPVKTLTEDFLASEKEFSSIDLSNQVDFKVYNVSLDSVVPEFLVNEAVSRDPFTNEVCNYSSYCSDSGEGSSSRQDDIKELKSRLEDAMKSNDDYRCKRSDEECGGKIVTPDDERSSDSGFRDKGSLSESAEDTCDEKYNLEDIDTEPDECREEETKKGEGWFLHPAADRNGWLPESTEYEIRQSLSLDADFINAIRCELREKLPQANVSLDDDDNSSVNEEVEEECVEVENIVGLNMFGLPVQLSPILEERESNQSSLILDDISPVNSLDTPQTDNHLNYDLNIDDSAFNGEDVLVVDTETNQATLIESPKARESSVFSAFRSPLPDDDGEDEYGDSPEKYAIHRESVGFTSDASIGSSSPERGDMSGFFLSPCSVRSDLFDSGPPSLPFDITHSLDETEDLSPSILPDLVTSSLNNSAVTPQSPDNLKLSSPLDDSISKSFDSTIKNTTDTSTEDNTLVSSVNDDTIIRNPNGNKLSEDYFTFESDQITSTVETPLSELAFPAKDIVLKEDFKDEVDNSEFLNNEYGNGDSKMRETEKEIDLLITNNNNINNGVTDVKAVEESAKNENDKKRNGWLEELLSERQSGGPESDGWPSADELVVKTLPEAGLSSTIALSSPGESDRRYPAMPLTPCSEGDTGDATWRPTINQLMDLAAAEGDTDDIEMTTSFIEPGDGTLTPDWDSDTSDSSSSGEFIWKSEDGRRTGVGGSESQGSDSESCSEEGSCSSEFVPSTWDSSLTPSKSSMRSPYSVPVVEEESEKIVDGSDKEPQQDCVEIKKKKKKVVFKKEKYQCIYEYPREPSDDEQDMDQDLDHRPSWHTPYSSSIYDYFDWELGDSEINVGGDADSDSEEAKSMKKESSSYDLYRLNYNYNPSFQLDEGEFFSKCFGSNDKGSEFFPGGDLEVDSGDEFTPLASDVELKSESGSESAPEKMNNWPQERPTVIVDNNSNSNNLKDEIVDSNEIQLQPPPALGVLRHTKDQLKLDLKPQQQQPEQPAALPIIADIRGEANILDTAIETPTA